MVGHSRGGRKGGIGCVRYLYVREDLRCREGNKSVPRGENDEKELRSGREGRIVSKRDLKGFGVVGGGVRDV